MENRNNSSEKPELSATQNTMLSTTKTEPQSADLQRLISSVLRGEPYEYAKAFGAPCINARYKSATLDSYEKAPNAVCAVCGSQAEEVHHEPPKGVGGRKWFALRTVNGFYYLRPSLIALCPRCHRLRHAGEIKFRWVWMNEEVEASWWQGELQQTVAPNSPDLLAFGHWEIVTSSGTRGIAQAASKTY